MLKKLINKIWPATREEVDKLVSELEGKSEVLEYLRNREQELIRKNDKLTKEKSELVSEVSDLRTKIRKQTEADLFLESCRLIKEILDGGDVKSTEFTQRRVEALTKLRQQQLSQLMCNQQQLGGSSLFKGILG